MSEPIGPGDWVECIDPYSRSPLPGVMTPAEHGALMSGVLYFVEHVGSGRLSGEALLWLRGVRPSAEGGYCLWRFRPIRDGQERIVKKERDSA